MCRCSTCVHSANQIASTSYRWHKTKNISHWRLQKIVLYIEYKKILLEAKTQFIFMTCSTKMYTFDTLKCKKIITVFLLVLNCYFHRVKDCLSKFYITRITSFGTSNKMPNDKMHLATRVINQFRCHLIK